LRRKLGWPSDKAKDQFKGIADGGHLIRREMAGA
jgi:hypothetical protein